MVRSSGASWLAGGEVIGSLLIMARSLGASWLAGGEVIRS